jgi:hypothetical protein
LGCRLEQSIRHGSLSVYNKRHAGPTCVENRPR